MNHTGIIPTILRIKPRRSLPCLELRTQGVGLGGAEVHSLIQRVYTDVENASSQQTGWKLQARPEKALLSTVQADASCVPHSNPGLGSLLPLILQLEKLDAN